MPTHSSPLTQAYGPGTGQMPFSIPSAIHLPGDLPRLSPSPTLCRRPRRFDLRFIGLIAFMVSIIRCGKSVVKGEKQKNLNFFGKRYAHRVGKMLGFSPKSGKSPKNVFTDHAGVRSCIAGRLLPSSSFAIASVHQAFYPLRTARLQFICRLAKCCLGYTKFIQPSNTPTGAFRLGYSEASCT